MLDLKALLSKILGCCYIKGTSGNWTYKKYLDGTLEQWYIGNPGAYTVGTARGNWYSGGNLTFTYPISFTSSPVVNASLSIGTTAYVVMFQLNGFNETFCQGRIVAGSSIAQNSNYWIFIHAIGKWGGVIEFIKSKFNALKFNSLLTPDWGWCVC